MNPTKTPVDPFGVANSFQKATEYWLLNSVDYGDMLLKLVSNLQAAASDELGPLLADSSKWAKPEEDSETAFLNLVRRQSRVLQKIHAVMGGWARDYVGRAEGISEKEKQCSAFWIGQMLNCLSPANYFWTNPSAVQKFMRTKGRSIVAGYEHWLNDANSGDMVKIADRDAFKVGENLATTPGQVVFRNRIMELIQYSPTTDTTFNIPIVLIQPWVNKFYIFDLTEDKSFVSYLVNQGFTVFVTSWKNPSPEMRDTTFEDYMLRGALKAVEVAREICGAEQVHAAGYCIGGTVLSSLMAWLNRDPNRNGSFPIRDFTLFASLVDYSSPGELGVYVNEDSVAAIEKLVKKVGYLDKKYISAGFRLLRPNDLIWRYHVHNYLQGEEPPKSDFLYWNSDATRLPAAMCTWFLKELYLKNQLIEEDAIVLANRPLSLRRIEQPAYIIGAELDHICPWKETFKTTQLLGGPVRFTMAGEGHITGIVNPPSPRSKRKFWTGEVNGESNPEEWLARQPERTGSWWTDWVEWLSKDSYRKDPPPIGSSKYCPLEKAPGSYVKEE